MRLSLCATEYLEERPGIAVTGIVVATGSSSPLAAITSPWILTKRWKQDETSSGSVNVQISV
jgi:hypothetical protein